MGMNEQEAVLSAYIASIGKRTPRDAAQDAGELCRLETSLNRLNEIACNSSLTDAALLDKHRSALTQSAKDAA